MDDDYAPVHAIFAHDGLGVAGSGQRLIELWQSRVRASSPLGSPRL